MTEMLNLLSRVVTADPKRLLFRPTVDRPAEVWPGVYSADPRFCRFKYDLCRFISDSFPNGVDADGFAGPSALTSNAYGALAVPGYEMEGAIPLTDNVSLRDELKLPRDFLSQRHVALYDELFDCMFGTRLDTASAHIARVSMTGLPDASLSPVYKANLMDPFFKDPLSYLSDMGSADLARWLKRRGFPLQWIGKRLQSSDGAKIENGQPVVKERLVPTLDYALSGGRKGTRYSADRRLSLPGVDVPHWRMRRRATWAPSAAANYPGTIGMSQQRAWYLSEYAFTFHHTTPAAIAEKLAPFELQIAFDVTNYDTTNPRFMLERFLKNMRKYWHDDYVNMAESLMFSHFWQPPRIANDSKSWVCSTDDPKRLFDRSVCAGLTSGSWFNPDVGKFHMTFDVIVALDELIGGMLGNVHEFLKGRHPMVGLLDSADDIRLGIKRGSPLADLAPEWQKGKPFTVYFKAEYGKGSFLGTVFYKDTDHRICTAPSLLSFVANWFAAERPITHPARTLWPLGWLERKKHYSSAPLAAEIYAEVDRLWAHHLPGIGSLDGVAQQWLEKKMGEQQLAAVLALQEQWSAADLAVLLDPSKLYYQIDAEVVNPAILDMFQLAIPAIKVNRVNEQIYSGRVRSTTTEAH